MNLGSLRAIHHSLARRPLSSRVPPALVVTALTGLAMLVGAAQLTLHSHSLKWAFAGMAAGLALAAFLSLPRKYSFLLFLSGFSIPYFIRIALFSRDQAQLLLTGTTASVAVLGLLGALSGRITAKRLRIEPTVTIPMVVFLCACSLSLINTTDRLMTLVTILRQVEMLALFLVIMNSVRDREDLVIFLRGFYWAFFLQCGIYVLQNLLGVSFDVVGNTKMVGVTDVEAGRIGSQRGTFDAAPSVVALYFSLLTLSLTGLYLCRKKLALRLTPLAGMVLGGGCLVLSTKRAPIAGFVLGLLTMCLLLYRRAPGALHRLARVLAVLAIPVVVLLPVLLLRAEANHEAAYEERMNLTRVAWEMFHAHPVIGVGYGTYDTVKRAYLPPDWSGWLYLVHNQYLMDLAETGAVGLGASLLVYIMILRAAYRGIGLVDPAFRPLQVALVAVFPAIFWEMYWDTFNGRQQGYMLWFLVALAVLVPRILRSEPAAKRV